MYGDFEEELHIADNWQEEGRVYQPGNFSI